MEMKTKFDERIAISSSQIRKLEREKNDISIKRPALRNAINESIGEISKLQTEEEVNELIHCQYWYLVWNVVVICLWFKLQAHKSLKNEQDTCIQNIFSSYNLGSLPKPPFSAANGLNLNNHIKPMLRDLEEDLEDKKKANKTELKMAWDSYLSASESWQNADAKLQTKRGNQGNFNMFQR